MALRPERIRLYQGAAEPSHRNVLGGTLRQVAYYGERSLLGVEIQGCGIVQVSVSERSAGAETWTIGDRMWLSWDPTAGRLLTA